MTIDELIWKKSYIEREIACMITKFEHETGFDVECIRSEVHYASNNEKVRSVTVRIEME